jgi:hypothetical protein
MSSGNLIILNNMTFIYVTIFKIYTNVAYPLIRLKRIYIFLCSMLVLTPFALSFVTLRVIFMHFLELTY